MAIKRNLHNNSFSAKRDGGASGRNVSYGASYSKGRRKQGARAFSDSAQISNVAGYGSAGPSGAGGAHGAHGAYGAHGAHGAKHSARKSGSAQGSAPSLGSFTSSEGFSGAGSRSSRGNKGGRSGSGRRAGRGKQAQPTSRMQGSRFLDKEVTAIPTSNGEILLTRRHFLYGAAGVGVLAAAGTGAKAYSDAKASENAVSVLTVPESAVTKSTDLTEVENGGKLSLASDITLPYGTLMWASTDDVAALLLPTETGSPLTTVSILRLASGYYFPILSQAVGAAEGFEIYDVRASAEGVVWTEVNILEGVWRIYGAPLADASLGTPQLLDQDTSDWETPSLAICQSTAFWQVLPNADGPKKSENSTLRCAPVTGRAGAGSAAGAAGAAGNSAGDADANDAGSTGAAGSAGTPSAAETMAATSANGLFEVVYTSKGRMATPLYASDDQITLTPRADASGMYYQLTTINASTREIIDTVTLPQAMKPLETGYGQTGFMFSFEGIYSYGDGISNLGTYAPQTDARGADYNSAAWFHFARTPSAPPCWCGNYLIVKSTRSVVGVDLESETYFLLDSVSGSDTYGDYLASTGNRRRILMFANVNDETASSGSSQYCSARIYSAY